MTEPLEGGFGEDNLDDFSYDFDRWSGEVKGRVQIPEPSTDMVVDFFSDWAITANAAQDFDREEAPLKGGDGPDKDEPAEESDAAYAERLQRNLANGTKAQLEAVDKQMQLISDVCRGAGTPEGEGKTPSVADLQRLPHRVRRAFNIYVMKKLNPQA